MKMKKIKKIKKNQQHKIKMIYNFENNAYTTPVGEVSNPFRTRFGFHILKVKIFSNIEIIYYDRKLTNIMVLGSYGLFF